MEEESNTIEKGKDKDNKESIEENKEEVNKDKDEPIKEVKEEVTIVKEEEPIEQPKEAVSNQQDIQPIEEEKKEAVIIQNDIPIEEPKGTVNKAIEGIEIEIPIKDTNKDLIIKEKKDIFCFSYSKQHPLEYYFDSDIIQCILLEFTSESIYETFIKQYNSISFFKFKRFDSYNPSNTFQLIKTLNKKILFAEGNKPSFPQHLENKILTGNGRLVLNYQTLSQIVDYLLFLLNRAITQNAEKEITFFISKGSLSALYSVKVNERELKIDYFWKIRSIEIKIADAINNDSINLDKVIFFDLFYNALFINTTSITIDLNITKLNDIYLGDNSPYKMRKNSIENVSMNFSNYIIANYILLLRICQKSKKGKFDLNLKLNDDYIYEIETVLWSQIEGLNANNPLMKPPKDMTHLVFYSHLNLLKKLQFFECSINALDKLLFKNMLYVIFNNNDLIGFSIRLFPNEISKRKTLLNNFILDKKDEESIDNVYKHYDILHQDKYDWSHRDNNVIRDEFILDFLFEDFNLNLTRLLVIIQKKSTVSRIKMNCDLPEEIRLKLNYSYAIGYFIYNLFSIFTLKGYPIKFDLFEIKSNVDLPESFFNAPITPVNLSNLTINQLHITLKNVAKFISFDDLPTSLTQLTCNAISFEDLTRLAQGIQRKRYSLALLKSISIEVNYTQDENYDEPLRQLILGLPDTLTTFNYRMKTYANDTLIVNTINYLIKLQNVEDRLYAQLEYFIPELDEDDDDDANANDKRTMMYISQLRRKILIGSDSSKKICFKYYFNDKAKNELSIEILKYSINNNMLKQYQWLDRLITNLNKKSNVSKQNCNNMINIYSILGMLNYPYQRLMIRLVFNRDN